VSRGRSSPGVRFPFKAGPRLGCPCSGFATSCLRSRGGPTSPGIASPGVLAPSSTTTTGAPSRSAAVLRPQRRGWRSPNPHRCRPQGSCPSRRFWLRSRHARDPCGSRRSPWHPDASRSCSIPLAPLESPCRAFPSRGAVPALAGLVLPCGFAFDRPTARQVRGFCDPFPRCADLSPQLARRLRRTVRPGRRFPGVARRRTSRVAAFVYGVSSRISRARRIQQPTRPLRSFAPLENPFTRQRTPWPGHGRRAGALLSLSL